MPSNIYMQLKYLIIFNNVKNEDENSKYVFQATWFIGRSARTIAVELIAVELAAVVELAMVELAAVELDRSLVVGLYLA